MITLTSGEVLVEVLRSDVVESLHRGHLLVTAPGGTALVSIGDVTAPIFPRSSLKPLQAVGMLRAGLSLVDDDLALAAASHDGESFHIAGVRAILADGGLDETDLACPPDLPLAEAARRTVLIGGGMPARILMNCSGKHAAMLRTCVVNDWPLSGYLSPEHPLQRQLRTTVEELCSEPIAAVGVDGCGAPLFAVSLTGLARAFARLGTATAGPEHAVADAMRRFPAMVGGTHQSGSRLMAGIPGAIVKAGAEGVYAVALADGGALAVKIDDGAPRAADRVAVAALRRLGATGAILDELAEQPVLGGGEPVGAVRMHAAL
ncbi:MAG: asparaginase [Jatrophihabitans sp.]